MDTEVEPFWKWLRRAYVVVDPPAQDFVSAFDRETAEPLGVWEEGGLPPEFMFERYLVDVPGAREEYESSIKEHPEWASYHGH